MKINTVEELQDILDEDLSWRKKELIDIKRLVNSDDRNKDFFIRAGIALLSAHFEGFIRNAAKYYVIFVSCQKIPIKDIKNNFISLKLKKKIIECGLTEKCSIHTTLFDKLDQIKSGYFGMKFSEGYRIIETNSNPTSKVFEEIVKSIGLSFFLFDIKKKYIDYNMLSKRHEIVHGEKTILDKEDFIETYMQIMDTIESFKKIIIEAAEGKEYLKTS